MSRRLDDLSPRFRPLAVELLARLTEAGIPVLIVDTLRTAAEHAENLKKGSSWITLSQHLDGKTRGFPHHGSDAIDLCPYAQYDLHGPDKLQWDAKDPVWQKIGAIGEALHLRWGGRWSPPDLSHFEFQHPPTHPPAGGSSGFVV